MKNSTNLKNAPFEIANSARLRSRKNLCQSSLVATGLSLGMLGIIPAYAQDVTSNVTIRATTVQHAIAYLTNGGTRAEADSLASEMLQEARTDIAKQQEAVKPPQGKPSNAGVPPISAEHK